MNDLQSLIAESKDLGADYSALFQNVQRTTDRAGIVDFSSPVAVTLELTHICNLNCLVCYNNSGTAVKGELTTEEWLEVIKQMFNMRVCQCHISGGEPFMFKGVFQVLDSLHSHGIHTMIFTNGWFIDDKIAARLSRYKPSLRIVVSIYGPRAKLHDTIRGSNGSWARAVSAAKHITAEGIPLHVHHCITKENLSALPEMIDLAFKLGTEKIVLSDTILIGRAAFVSSRVDVSHSRRRIYDIVRRKVREYKGRMEIELSLAAPLGLRYYSMNPNMAILLTPIGDARLDFITPVVFGNIRHESLEQIWNRMKHAWRENRDVVKFVQSIHTNSDLLDTPFGIPNITDHVRADR